MPGRSGRDEKQGFNDPILAALAAADEQEAADKKAAQTPANKTPAAPVKPTPPPATGIRGAAQTIAGRPSTIDSAVDANDH